MRWSLRRGGTLFSATFRSGGPAAQETYEADPLAGLKPSEPLATTSPATAGFRPEQVASLPGRRVDEDRLIGPRQSRCV